jgi:DNA-binding transcriptional LysR family regulator
MMKLAHLARIDLNLLVLFQVVLDERHVGRAAGRLNLTPSAVSHGLGRLRKLLNNPLFLRTPKGVVPTARALTLREPVAEILARVQNVLGSAAPAIAQADADTVKARETALDPAKRPVGQTESWAGP